MERRELGNKIKLHSYCDRLSEMLSRVRNKTVYVETLFLQCHVYFKPKAVCGIVGDQKYLFDKAAL